MPALIAVMSRAVIRIRVGGPGQSQSENPAPGRCGAVSTYNEKLEITFWSYWPISSWSSPWRWRWTG